MEEEIENYIKKSNEELEKECDDIRNSYKEDIAGFEGKFYNLLIKIINITIRHGRRIYSCS